MLLAVASCALAGCGTTTRQQVRAKVEQFAHAVAAKDAGTICGQVLATTLLERFAQVGLPCPRAMQTFFTSVHNPTLAVGNVAVKGRLAEAIILTGARGQEKSLDSLELVQTSAGWRIYGLGASVLPGAAGTTGTASKTAPATTPATTTTATTTTTTGAHHSSRGKSP